uniref:Uncharacterized protein n=1 Tax=Trichuris muris TaxID=70415 RepID=A0A5S6QZA4_TRIMR
MQEREFGTVRCPIEWSITVVTRNVPDWNGRGRASLRGSDNNGPHLSQQRLKVVGQQRPVMANSLSGLRRASLAWALRIFNLEQRGKKVRCFQRANVLAEEAFCHHYEYNGPLKDGQKEFGCNDETFWSKAAATGRRLLKGAALKGAFSLLFVGHRTMAPMIVCSSSFPLRAIVAVDEALIEIWKGKRPPFLRRRPTESPNAVSHFGRVPILFFEERPPEGQTDCDAKSLNT